MRNLRLRDGAWLSGAEQWFQSRGRSARCRACTDVRAVSASRSDAPQSRGRFSHGAVQGGRRHAHRLAFRPLRGACQGRRRAGLHRNDLRQRRGSHHPPGCPGLYEPAHEAAWKRLVDFIHSETSAKVCIQLGHAGAKGSTQLGWETMDAPLPSGNWPVMAASATPWSTDNQVPREMSRADMNQVRDQFAAAAQAAERAGFDMLELHMAHGYLLSSFITPLTNQRMDDYGGGLENRLRYPLEIFAAVRAVWPEHKPMSVRISATDWVGDDGVTPEEAVEIARAFKKAGVDIIDVSAGQTSIQAQPVYGRMFQTPFSDRIRNEVGLPTMAVGNIFEPDHVNSILMAGRADLVCLARPHLADPYWTLHAAAALNDRGVRWPDPYLPGRDQLYRLAERTPGAGGVK